MVQAADDQMEQRAALVLDCDMQEDGAQGCVLARRCDNERRVRQHREARCDEKKNHTNQMVRQTPPARSDSGSVERGTGNHHMAPPDRVRSTTVLAFFLRIRTARGCDSIIGFY